MKNIKRIFAAVMALSMLAAAAGCGSSTSASEKESQTKTEAKNDQQSSDSGFPDSLTDNLYDFRVQLDNEVLSVPVTLETLENAGWNCTSVYTQVPGKTGYEMNFEKDNKKIAANVVNHAEEDSEPILLDSDEGKKQLMVTYITIDTLVDEESAESMTFSLPNDIATGATIEEVKTAYGEPTEIKETYAKGGGNRDGFIYVYKNTDETGYAELSFKSATKGKGSSVAHEEDVSLTGVKIYCKTEK